MELLIVPLFLMALGTAAAVVENRWTQWAAARCRAWWTQRQPRRNVLPFDRLADRRAGDWTDADCGGRKC